MGQSTQECKHLTLELSLVNILHHYLLTLQYNKRQTIRPDVCAFMSVFGLNFKLPDSPLLACLQVKTYFTWEICLSYTHTPVADVVSQALSPRHPFYNITSKRRRPNTSIQAHTGVQMHSPGGRGGETDRSMLS